MQTTSIPLYDLPRFSLFTLADIEDTKVPVAALTPVDKVYKLHNIDGMYSYCTDVDKQEVYHFAAWTQVNPL